MVWVNLAPVGSLFAILTYALFIIFAKNCPKAVYHIMLDCWIEDKTRRPKFADIVSRLEELICSPDLLRDDMIDRVNR